jgi:hypothetical protein
VRAERPAADARSRSHLSPTRPCTRTRLKCHPGSCHGNRPPEASGIARRCRRDRSPPAPEAGHPRQASSRKSRWSPTTRPPGRKRPRPGEGPGSRKSMSLGKLRARFDCSSCMDIELSIMNTRSSLIGVPEATCRGVCPAGHAWSAGTRPASPRFGTTTSDPPSRGAKRKAGRPSQPNPTNATQVRTALFLDDMAPRGYRKPPPACYSMGTCVT